MGIRLALLTFENHRTERSGMTFSYVWSNGVQEVSAQTETAVRQILKSAGHGKIWRRQHADDGLIEGVTDITGLICRWFGTLAECREPSECTRVECGR